MIYYVVATGAPVDTPWRIPSPDGLSEIVKSNTVPAIFESQLTGDEARTLATEWTPPMPVTT
jgi:hypothetical protein